MFERTSVQVVIRIKLQKYLWCHLMQRQTWNILTNSGPLLHIGYSSCLGIARVNHNAEFCLFDWRKSSCFTKALNISKNTLKYIRHTKFLSWWRHQMETFSALLAICAGNSPIPGEFPALRPITRSFNVFFDLRLNKRLSKQSWGWWFETPSRPLWRHRNLIYVQNKQYSSPVASSVYGLSVQNEQFGPVPPWARYKHDSLLKSLLVDTDFLQYSHQPIQCNVKN